MGRRAEALLGVLLLALLAAALPVGFHFASRQREIRLTVAGPAAHEIAASPAQLGPVAVGPPELLPRIDAPRPLEGSDPGLFLRTWQVTYGRRWERQVTWPVLAGPFDPEGSPWPCSLAVRLSPRFFDDGAAGGGDVESFVERVVRAQFPFTVLGLHFAAVSSTSLHVRPVPGAIEVSGGIVLADSRRDPTQFSLKGRIVLGERDGDLTAKLEGLQVSWRGKTRRDPLVELASIFVDVDDQARSVVASRLGGALAILRLPREPIALFDDRPKDRITLRLCGPPEVRADGLTVRLRVKASLAEPRLEPAVPGPPHLDVRPELGPAAEGAPTLEAAASASAAQQALYLFWQSGELAAWGRRGRVVAALRDKVKDRVAFDVTAADAHLPPVVVPSGDGGAFRIRFGDLELGRLDAAPGARVVAHGDFLGKARVEEGRLGLAGTLEDLHVDCVEARGDGLRVSPCFSDVVPVLRETGLSSEGIPLDLGLPDRLLRVSLVMGTDLVLGDLKGEVVGSPPQLLLRGDARLVRRGAP